MIKLIAELALLVIILPTLVYQSSTVIKDTYVNDFQQVTPADGEVLKYDVVDEVQKENIIDSLTGGSIPSKPISLGGQAPISESGSQASDQSLVITETTEPQASEQKVVLEESKVSDQGIINQLVSGINEFSEQTISNITDVVRNVNSRARSAFTGITSNTDSKISIKQVVPVPEDVTIPQSQEQNSQLPQENSDVIGTPEVPTQTSIVTTSTIVTTSVDTSPQTPTKLTISVNPSTNNSIVSGTFTASATGPNNLLSVKFGIKVPGSWCSSDNYLTYDDICIFSGPLGESPEDTSLPYSRDFDTTLSFGTPFTPDGEYTIYAISLDTNGTLVKVEKNIVINNQGTAVETPTVPPEETLPPTEPAPETPDVVPPPESEDPGFIGGIIGDIIDKIVDPSPEIPNEPDLPGETLPPTEPAPETPYVLSSSIKVLYPNGGENLQVGQTINITWSGLDLSSPNINIYLLDEPTRMGTLIGTNIPADQKGGFSWIVSVLRDMISDKTGETINPSGRYVIAIECTDHSCTSDESDNYFTISIAESSIIGLPEESEGFIDGLINRIIDFVIGGSDFLPSVPPPTQIPVEPALGNEAKTCIYEKVVGGWIGNFLNSLFCASEPPSIEEPKSDILPVPGEPVLVGPITGEEGDGTDESFNVGGSVGGSTGGSSGPGSGSTGGDTSSGGGADTAGPGSGDTSPKSPDVNKDIFDVDEYLRDALNDDTLIDPPPPPDYKDTDQITLEDSINVSQGYFDCPALVAFDLCHNSCGNTLNSCMSNLRIYDYDNTNVGTLSKCNDEYTACTNKCGWNIDSSGKKTPPYCLAQ